MEESRGACGGAGHFSNDSDRHTEIFSGRNDEPYREGLFLYDQRVTYTGEDRPTVALQVGDVYGQARIVEVESRTLDPEAEGDGSVSIPYIQQNGNGSVQRECNLQPVASIQQLDNAFPIDQPIPPAAQSALSLLGVTRLGQQPSLPSGSIQDDFSPHAQSCSGLSDLNINRLAPQLEELPSYESTAIQLNRQENLSGACGQQTLCVVSDDHVEPVDTQAQQAVLIGLIGNKAFQDNWLRCYTSCIRKNLDEQTAKAFANQLLICRNNGSAVECLHCGSTGDISRNLVHQQQCPVLKSLQKIQDNMNVRNANGAIQSGACGTDVRGNEMHSQTDCKKPKGEAAIPPCYPLQVSDAAADRQSDVVFPPRQQNETHITPNQSSQGTGGRDEEYVRAECAGDLGPNQERIEPRMSGNEVSTSSSGMRSCVSTPSTSSSMYRTASADGTLQGGGDRDTGRIRHPAYADLNARFLTFCSFPKSVPQPVQALTEAGLFYTGKKDECKCFHCAGPLHSWAKDDDPWFEHARHFPNCPFVKEKKGQEYINAIKRAFSVAGRESQQVQDPVARSQDLADLHAQVQGMGFSRSKAVNAFEEHKRRVDAGRTPKGVDTLNAVLDILSEESDLAEGHKSQSTDQQANRMDATYCSACKRHKATVSQQKCGHIVCFECAPRRGDQSRHHCRFCKQEVVDCYPIDTSFFHKRA